MAKPIHYLSDGSYLGDDGFIHKELSKSSAKSFAVWSELWSELMAKHFPEHGRTCECYPCQQSNYRMNRDDPSVEGVPDE